MMRWSKGDSNFREVVLLDEIKDITALSETKVLSI